MSYIWSLFLAASFAASLLTCHTSSLSAAALLGAQEGFSLCLSLGGSLCLWSGVMRVMEKSGLADALCGLFRPLLSRLFPETFRDETARRLLSANFSANLLGLGSAATPMGTACVRRMQALRPEAGTRASDEMCRLVVMNTASIQLIPTTVCALRAQLGAASPFEILPAVWLSSVLSLGVGLLAAVCMEKLS